MSLAEMVEAGARNAPDLDVLTFEHDGHSEVRTYQQLWDNARRFAAGLAQRGLQHGDRVALMLYNHPECVEAMIACAIGGWVFVPIDARTRGDRLASEKPQERILIERFRQHPESVFSSTRSLS